MTDKLIIEWQGKGHYRRVRNYTGSSENGIRLEGHRWERTVWDDPLGHNVNDVREIRRTLEPRYH
jgi:hypothetical protein